MMKNMTFIFLMLFPGTHLSFSQEKFMATPEKTVQTLYDLVTFETGTTPDWEKVRSLFIDEAVIVLRTARDSTTVFTLEGFVNDFIAFIEKAGVKSTGFSEKILTMKTLEFGDMASVLVLYEAHITGSDRPPSKGVDNFSLIKKEDRWWIISVTNELPTPDRSVPEVLQN
jgi:hypothetical protein